MVRWLFAFALIFILIGCGPNKPHENFQTWDYVSYDTSDPVRIATIYTPKGFTGLRPWIFGIHGGAFMGGSRYDLQPYAVDFSPEGWTVVSVDYHHSSVPGGVWPAALRDCQAALRYFRANARMYGLDPDRFVVMGGSAGGCLATHLGLEDDPEGPLGRATHIVDNAGEQDLRLLDQCMFNDNQITELLLGHPAPWSEAELLGPSNIQRARPDVDFFIIHGTNNQDVYVRNSDELVQVLQNAGAQVNYQRVIGGDMFALSGDPQAHAALFAWLRDRLK